jgi:hypothetical protein
LSYPTIDLDERTVILLSGFEATETVRTSPVITAREELVTAVKRHHDAVAFGYVLGKWMPAA